MAHHKSAIKRIKTNKIREARNKYEKKTLRTFVRNVKTATDPEIAEKALQIAISKLDKAARKGLIHKNKAARSKSRLTKQVRALRAE